MTIDMRKLVEEGYEKGNYVSEFRTDLEPDVKVLPFLKDFIELLPEKAKILDLGCGTGIPFDRYLVEKGFEVTGVDFSQKHIELAKRNVPEARFIKGDFSDIDFGEESFHAIVSFYAIFHIPRDEHKALFVRMSKHLKKEGIILVTLGTSGSEYGEDKDWLGAPMAWSSYHPDKAKEIISKSGFRILKTFFEGDPGDDEYHFWVLAMKE
jgi:cyclopropane fatty-acyl-phospholipid synthase-like methyltransferase